MTEHLHDFVHPKEEDTMCPKVLPLVLKVSHVSSVSEWNPEEFHKYPWEVQNYLLYCLLINDYDVILLNNYQQIKKENSNIQIIGLGTKKCNLNIDLVKKSIFL